MWCFKRRISPGAWTLLGGLAGTVWSFPHRVHCLCSAVCCRLEPRIVSALGLVVAVATPVWRHSALEVGFTAWHLKLSCSIDAKSLMLWWGLLS